MLFIRVCVRVEKLMSIKQLEIVIARNIEHKFSWYILARAPVNTFKRRILEAYLIKLIVPSLNEQLDNDVLMLFRNGVT